VCTHTYNSRVQTLQAVHILTEREREEHIFGTEPRSREDRQTGSASRAGEARHCETVYVWVIEVFHRVCKNFQDGF